MVTACVVHADTILSDSLSMLVRQKAESQELLYVEQVLQ